VPLIHASSDFDEVNVISKAIAEHTEKTPESNDKKTFEPILKNIQLSKISLVYNTVYNLAEVLDKHAKYLIDNTFYAIQESRDNYLDQLEHLSVKTMKNLLLAIKIENDQEKHREQLKILNEFSFQAQKELATFKDILLKNEHEILHNGITRFIAASGNSVYNLPENIRLKFDKDDFRELKTVHLLRQINKAVKIIWTRISGKKISVKINLKPAAGYLIYYKRLEFIRQFYENYTEQSLTAFTGIKELLNNNALAIEKAFLGKSNEKEIIAERERITADMLKLRANNQVFVYNQGHKLLDELATTLKVLAGLLKVRRLTCKAENLDILIPERRQDLKIRWLNFLIYGFILWLTVSIKLTSISFFSALKTG
jgi:hypothetical protein